VYFFIIPILQVDYEEIYHIIYDTTMLT